MRQSITVAEQLALPYGEAEPEWDLLEQVRRFREFGTATREEILEIGLDDGGSLRVPMLVNEFWTSRQRAAHSLHEISYRACFKGQLPAFFITRLTGREDRVYDPFMGRGTTLLEAALLGRRVAGCDINPLSEGLLRPRLDPPTLEEIRDRLDAIDLGQAKALPEDLLVFYHPATLRSLCSLRNVFLEQDGRGKLDRVDRWIRMVAINRLTGHSAGFFSVYTMPPNQAVSVEAQKKINARRKQAPTARDVRALILRKSKSLLRRLTCQEKETLRRLEGDAILLTGDSRATPEISEDSVDLVVTSPPFLDVVNYAADNWLRCWFMGIEAQEVPISILRKLEDWQAHMTELFLELRRILSPGATVAFEVGEIRQGKIRLEEAVLQCMVRAGLEPDFVLINGQEFTKTSNCWGVSNNCKGTNTNRIVVARRVS